jgi:transposase InsO family protein
VQRIVRSGPRDPVAPEQVVTASASRTLLAKRPNHVWMIDFTRIGGIFRPLWVGAVIDAYSRRVLAIGAVRGAPTGRVARSV